MNEAGLVRSFIAIPLPDDLKRAAGRVRDRLRESLPSVRWTKPEAMHLTLHFFGDIDEENLEKVAAVMVSIESLFAPFPATLAGVGAFPSPGRARVLWLGVDSEPLAALHAALTQGLRSAGFPCERRPFTPHITLGRSRGGPLKAGHILSQERDTVVGEMTVDGLVLYESELLPAGAVHRPRRTIHFTAGRT